MTLQAVLARTEAAAVAAGRDPAGITVVAVSKGRTPEQVRRLYDAGQRDFGENRAAELEDKAPGLPADIVWHFVGRLQSRKARTVRPIASFLHSLDRDSLAQAWLKGRADPPPAFLQVNIGAEPQKGGMAVEEAVAAAVRWAGWGIPVAGLMAMPPEGASTGDLRRYFADLARLGSSVSAEIPSAVGLSMGMSDDFEVAIAQGATCIRVGRAIFDDQQSKV